MADKQMNLDLEPKKSGPVECLGMTFESDEARRAYFLERLEEKLQDPEFRKVPGFPRGSDEDILRMSDPPYYTACPNPFMTDFLASIRSDDSNSLTRVDEPLSFDVSIGKGDPVYQAHSYHTKVPHKAIMHYVLHYTEPGDVVLDGFCGTGMTGVAVQECTNSALVNELGFPTSKVGIRYGLLNDLSVLAAFIASNFNGQSQSEAVHELFLSFLKNTTSQYHKLYRTRHSKSTWGTVHYYVWSDVFVCPNCAHELVYWDVAIDLASGLEKSEFCCPSCAQAVKKRTLERAFETMWDDVTQSSYRAAKRTLVYINYEVAGTRYFKKPDSDDFDAVATANELSLVGQVPLRELPKADRYYKDGLHLVGLDYVHRFYHRRTLLFLAHLWDQIISEVTESALRNRLFFCVTSMLDRNLTIRNRFVINKHNPRGRINGPLANSLYVPGLSVEQNPSIALAYKADDIKAALRNHPSRVLVGTADLGCLRIPDSSVDYIFVDPPFGHNIMYSELNVLSEAWLGLLTNSDPEAVVNESQQKDVQAYMQLMRQCFATCARVLKPGKWITVEFHNSSNHIWTAIQEALLGAGFIIADISTLDKQKGTINQEFYTRGAVKQDLVITAYKPGESFFKAFILEGGTELGVWTFVEERLGRLPKPRLVNGEIVPVVERMDYMLYDRMVAFHIQQNVTVPLSASAFYAGLEQRFDKREGMYFLTSQLSEIDRLLSGSPRIQQLSLSISDERSAIFWVRAQLAEKPRSFQELQPLFLQAIKGWVSHEEQIELTAVLHDNFLLYEGHGSVPSQIHTYLSSNFKDMRGLAKDAPVLTAKATDRWYVPDPNKQEDLEQLRTKRLLKEFAEYKASKQKKLKQFRTEAIRAGFKAAYDQKDYRTILEVARKLPERVIQEDEKLLMYYDVASMRLGED